MHDTRAEGTKHTEAAGGVTAQYGGERKSLVFEWTSSITNRWDVTKIYKKRVYRSAHNFWCSFRVHRIREQELSRSRFSGISFFHLDQIQKCHKNVTFFHFFWCSEVTKCQLLASHVNSKSISISVSEGVRALQEETAPLWLTSCPADLAASARL